jgi:hypothetical protein
MYMNGIPGASDAFQRTQAMTLTRLVRAAAAIAVIDLSRVVGTETDDAPPARSPARESHRSLRGHR